MTTDYTSIVLYYIINHIIQIIGIGFWPVSLSVSRVTRPTGGLLIRFTSPNQFQTNFIKQSVFLSNVNHIQNVCKFGSFYLHFAICRGLLRELETSASRDM